MASDRMIATARLQSLRLGWLFAAGTFVLLAAPAFALVDDSKAKSSCPNLIEVRARTVTPTACGPGQLCPSGQCFYRSGWTQSGWLDCRTGDQATLPSGCNTFPGPEWPAVGGPSSWDEPPGCVSGGSSEAAVMSDCAAGPMPAALPPPPKEETPAQCSAAPVPSNRSVPGSPARSSTPSIAVFNGVGDPVDLTTGQLQQTVVDLDVGEGLRFVRHYASNLDRSGAAITTAGPMGYNWIHSFQWALQYYETSGGNEFYLVRRPLGTPMPFFRAGGVGAFVTAPGNGKLEVDAAGATFTDVDGTRAWFDPSNLLTDFQPLGETPIHVSYGAQTETYARGGSSLTLTYTAGSPRYLASATGGGETVSYGYATASFGGNTVTLLATVTVPDRSSPPNTLQWTYDYHAYDGQYGPGLLTSASRSGTATPIAHWGWGYDSVTGATRVSSVDERDLDQALLLSYANEAGGVLATSVSDATQLLAVFRSKQGRIVSVTGSGGPGVAVPLSGATFESTASGLALDRWSTVAAPNSTAETPRWTHYEAYARDGAPGRIVEGWVDHDADGIFSAGDGYSRLRELVWHPRLGRPLSVSEPSALVGSGLDHVLIDDYDAPPGGLTDATAPNEAPTDLVSRRIEKGKTLDAGGNVVDAPDRITTYRYDSEQRLTLVVGPGALERTEIGYDGDGTNNTTGFRSSVKRCLDANCVTFLETTFSDFDPRGNPRTVVDPNDKTTTFTYDGLGRVTSVTSPPTGPESTTVGFKYDPDGNLVRIDFPPDSFAQPSFLRIGYDGKRNLLFVADAQQNALVWEYERSRTSRAARYVGFTDYATRGTLVGDSSFTHDTAGRLFRAFNPLFGDGSVYSEISAYDGAGNPLQIHDEDAPKNPGYEPDPRRDELVYDALDRLETLRQVREGTGTFETGLGYDVQSNVSQVTDPAAKATVYRSDDFGELVEVTSPDTGATRFLYDAAGDRVTKIENAAGSPSRTTGYAYDALHRLTQVDLPSDPDWIYTYDTDPVKNQRGRLAQVTNGIVTTAFEYTDRGQVALERTIVDGKRFDVVYGYDAAGRLHAVQAPSGTTATTSYAGLRPKTLTVTSGNTTQTIQNIAYFPFGPRTQVDFPPADGAGANTVHSTCAYNARGQMTELQVTAPTGTVLDQSYRYDSTAGAPGPVDPGPDLDELTDQRDPGHSRFFFYDALDRLWNATDLTGTALYSYGYDAVGNRSQEIGPGGTTTYGYEPGTDRLASATGAAPRYYAHDAFGNRIWAGATPYAGIPSYLFDESNRLVEVRDPANPTVVLAQYAYDAFGRRIRKVAGGKTVYSFYDQAGHLLETVDTSNLLAPVVRDFVTLDDDLVGVVDTFQSVGTPASTWPALRELPGALPPSGWLLVAGVSGMLLVLVGSSRRPQRAIAAALAGGALAMVGFVVVPSCGEPAPSPFSWVHTDYLGKPLAVTNIPTDGTPVKVVWRASYAPFGLATPNQDPDGDGVAFTLDARFPGQVYDAESGLHYNFYRDYDPATGRYLEADPIGQVGGVNVYQYAAGNPIGRIDRDGLYYAERLAAQGALVGAGVAGGASLVLDAVTGGLNTVVTLPEVALGAATFGGIGYIFGAIADAVLDVNGGGSVFEAKGLSPGYWDADEGAKEWGRRNGVGADEGKGRFHDLKKKCGGRGARIGKDNYGVNPDTGDVVDPEGDVIGNLGERSRK